MIFGITVQQSLLLCSSGKIFQRISAHMYSKSSNEIWY